MRTTVYCRCGAQLVMSAPDSDAVAFFSASRVIFLEAHRGKGHGPCDAKTASRARRRNEDRRVPPEPAGK